MIVDYSLARPSMAELRAVGATGVIRYLGWDCVAGFACERKNLTAPELATLMGAGFGVGVTFEYAANAALRGGQQGVADAGLADVQLAQLGMVSLAKPAGVFYAVDFDLPDFAPSLPETPANARAKLGPVANYFDALNTIAADHEVDGYGGYWAIRRLLDAGLIKRGWQTLAWSGSPTRWDPRAVLHQTGQTVLGDVDVDALEIQGTDPDWGQWPRPGVVPPPPPPGTWEETLVKNLPTVSERSTATAYVRRIQGLCEADSEALAIDGVFGAKTKAAVEAVQTRSGVSVDGVVGPQTWSALLTGAGLAAT